MRNLASATNDSKSGAKLWRWVLPVLVLGFIGAIQTVQYYVGSDAVGRPLSWWLKIPWQDLSFFFWVAMTPVIYWLGRQFKIERVRWWRGLVIHLLFGSAFSLARVGLYTYLTYAMKILPHWRPNPIDRFAHFIGMYFYIDLLTYSAILSIGLAMDYYHKYRENELQAAELRAQLSQAQLEALRVQLQPHFLFNTLNGIVGLIRNHENQDAIRMTTGLSDLLRHVLEHPGQQEVSLREELEFLSRYLHIQQMRFSDRLKVEMDVDKETLDAKVPSLILQPLVENAIRHGIAARDAEGVISLSASRNNGHLQINVYNDGPILPRDWQIENCGGIGLANTRARLEQLYGTDGQLELHNCGTSGVEAALTIPFLHASTRHGHSQEKDPRVDRG